MEILVCIKQVPGSTNVEIDPATGVLKRSGVPSKINPYDLFGIETALSLSGRFGGAVDCITMGPPQAKAVIKEAFAMGADEGYLMTDRKFAGADVLATSFTLSQVIVIMGEYDLIICGKQTTDGDTAQVGAEMAEWLGIPSVSNVVKIDDVAEDAITVTMEIPTAFEVAKIAYPCLISVEKDIFEPRLPSYIKRKATADREIHEITFASLPKGNEGNYGLDGSPTQVQRIFPPESNKKQEMWQGSGEELASQICDKIKELKLM